MADSAHDFQAFRRLADLEIQVRRFAAGGGGGDNESMEARVKALEEAVKNLPTKADFAELRSDVKTSMADLRAEMHKGNIDIHKWMIGTVIGLFLGFGGLFLAMSNALKSAPASTQTTQSPSAPIIITLPQPSQPSSGNSTAAPESK
ncbi:MAG: hypothetical protein RSE32_16985 [Comamonas sp.]|uniref:hypothetical protein n=1 Tax=Comamonas sp. TaxID=34028 RepID=UPI002FC6AF8E